MLHFLARWCSSAKSSRNKIICPEVAVNESESEFSFNLVKTPQLTKRSCDLQIEVHDNKDRNVITINKNQAQMLLLGIRSFMTVLRKESVRQSSEGPWVED